MNYLVMKKDYRVSGKIGLKPGQHRGCVCRWLDSQKREPELALHNSVCSVCCAGLRRVLRGRAAQFAAQFPAQFCVLCGAGQNG